MQVSKDVERIVDAAMAGERPGRDELVRLCQADEFSLDGYYISWAGREMARRACDGVAEVHAQIGIDSGPCSKNCRFCSFAACNTARTEVVDMPIDTVIEYVQVLVEDEANCVTMMTTADYDFGRFVDYIVQVRQAIGPEMPITANTGDLTYDMASRLKGAGANAIYHGIRMGEGELTSISLQDRFDTVAAAQKAGLAVQTCLEMVMPRFSDEDVVDRMLRVIDCRTDSLTIGGMVRVPGTGMFEEKIYSRPRYRMYNAIARLACHEETWTGGPVLSWAEVGTNPRDDSAHTEKTGRGSTVPQVRDELERDGWEVRRGPSTRW